MDVGYSAHCVCPAQVCCWVLLSSQEQRGPASCWCWMPPNWPRWPGQRSTASFRWLFMASTSRDPHIQEPNSQRALRSRNSSRRFFLHQVHDTDLDDPCRLLMYFYWRARIQEWSSMYCIVNTQGAGNFQPHYTQLSFIFTNIFAILTNKNVLTFFFGGILRIFICCHKKMRLL